MKSLYPTEHTLSLLENIAELSNGLQTGRKGSREGLINACESLISELRHPSEAMTQLLWAQPTHLNVIWMSVEVKLFQALAQAPDTGASVLEITKRCDKNIDATMAGRMLRHLHAMGTVRETGPGMFASTPTSRAFAEKAYQDSILYIAENFQPVLQGLPSYFRKHGGTNLFEYFGKHSPEMGQRFASMMNAWSVGRPRWFDEGYYPVQDRLINGAEPSIPFLVDVGGGSGHDITGLRDAFQDQLPGPLILQDRPEVVALAKLGPGIDATAHDMLSPQPVAGARAYFLHSIIHDWTDDVNIKILKAIVPAMKHGYSKILINEHVIPDQNAHWTQTCLDWELMASLGARQRTEQEHKRLYETAGLKITGIWRHRDSMDSLIELELV